MPDDPTTPSPPPPPATDVTPAPAKRGFAGGAHGGYTEDLKNDPYKLRTISQRRIDRLAREVREQNERDRKKMLSIQNTINAGVIASQPKPKSTARDEVREFLEECVKTRRGKVSKARLLHICESLFRTACDPRSPGQVHAARALLDRGFGPPAPADDSPAARKGGLTVVYVDRSALDPDIPVFNADEQPKQLAAPEFDEEAPIDGQ